MEQEGSAAKAVHFGKIKDKVNKETVDKCIEENIIIGRRRIEETKIVSWTAGTRVFNDQRRWYETVKLVL